MFNPYEGMTPEERQAYDEAMRGTLSEQLGELGQSTRGCLMVVFSPLLELCARWLTWIFGDK